MHDVWTEKYIYIAKNSDFEKIKNPEWLIDGLLFYTVLAMFQPNKGDDCMSEISKQQQEVTKRDTGFTESVVPLF